MTDKEIEEKLASLRIKIRSYEQKASEACRKLEHAKFAYREIKKLQDNREIKKLYNQEALKRI